MNPLPPDSHFPSVRVGNESPTSVNQQNMLNPFPEAPTAAHWVVFQTNVIANDTEQVGKVWRWLGVRD